ncbi:MAG: hypothetical protein HPY80_05795 [Bacteroidales bacterium]|nr:hypothetical protein [Bacteroidales bacterium]
MRKLFTLSFLVMAIFCTSNRMIGQINISVGSTVTQNFDGIGTSATATLPTGWKADKNTTPRTLGSYASAGTATEQRAGNNMSTYAANGIYNYGAGDATTATDRAVGGLSSSSASKSVNVYVQLYNNGTSAIDNFTISYSVEKYRNGSNPSGFSIQMHYSTDGSTWNSAGNDFLTSFPADGDNNGFASAPGATVSVTNKTLNQSLAAGSSLYLAWNYSVTSGTTTSNAQALSIDDVSITANAASTPTISVNPGTLSGFTYIQGSGPSGEQSFSVSGTNLTGDITLTASTNYEISQTSGSGFTSGTINLTPTGGTVNATTIYVRLKAGLSAGTYNENINITSTGASSQVVICNGTVISPPLFYRSKASGDWSSASSWEVSTDGSTWTDASTYPTSTDNTITIRNGHTITITSGVSIDQTTIEAGGEVIINTGIALTLANGAGTDLVISGTLKNSGTLTISGSTWQVTSGGTYIHNSTSGISTPLNAATLDDGSNFKYLGSSSLNTSMSVSNRTYSNLFFESSSGTWNASFLSGSNPLTVNGILTVGENVNLSKGAFTGALNFNNNIDIYGSFSGDNLTIAAGKTCTIYPSGSLTITNTLINNGSLSLQGNSTNTGSLIHYSGGVNATVVRNMNGSGQFHLISSPVTGAVVGTVFPEPQHNTVWLRQYDEPTGTWVNKFTSDIFETGKGYSMVTTDAGTQATFTGTLVNTDQTMTLSYLGTSGNSNYDGWNLLGNPFSSAIDRDLGTWNLTNVEPAVYVFDNGNYRSWNGGGTLTDGIIPMGQGFFMKAQVNNGTVTIPEGARVHSNQAFYKSSPVNTLRVDVSNSANFYTDALVIRYTEGATAQYDASFDARKLSGLTDAPEIWCPGDVPTSLNSLPSIEQQPEVTIAFKPAAPTMHTLSFSGIESFDYTGPIMLTDLVTGSRIDIRSQATYEYMASPTDPENRFKLTFASVGIDEPQALNGVNAWYQDGAIRLAQLPATPCQAELYSTDGKLLLSARVMPTQNHIPVSLKSAVYILRLLDGNQVRNIKFIVK